MAGQLGVRPGEQYRLNVTMADGRKYTSVTEIPQAAAGTIPDTVRVPVSIDPAFGRDYYIEGGFVAVPWIPAPGADVVVWGANRSLEADHYFWGIDPSRGEGLPGEDRNDYVRIGVEYQIDNVEYINPISTIRPYFEPVVGWAEVSNRAVINKHDLYLRLYQLNADLGRYYSPEDTEYSVSSGSPWAMASGDVEANAVSKRKTGYFASISNILRVGPDGRALPKAQSDAVGVFGAYGARYAHRILVPVRNFDPADYNWSHPAH